MEEKKKLGLALCGSYCTYAKLFEAAEKLAEKFDLVPIMSETASSTDSRFGSALSHIARLEGLCGRPVTNSIAGAERFGPTEPLDALLIAPCTGATLARISHGMTDSAVAMAAKAHLRNGRPLIIAFSTNDGLSGSAVSLGTLLERKGYFFVPLRQDAPTEKPRSLQCDFSLLPEAIEAALEGRQLQPIFLPPR